MEIQIIGFRVGGEFYAINILSVAQIIHYQQPTKLAQAPDFVEGIINLRGQVIPLVDLRKRYGAEVKFERSNRIIIACIEPVSKKKKAAKAEQAVGLVVDAVSNVVRTDTEKSLRAPTVLTQSDSAYTGDVHQDADGRLYMLLDPTKILTSREQRELTQNFASDAL